MKTLVASGRSSLVAADANRNGRVEATSLYEASKKWRTPSTDRRVGQQRVLLWRER